MKALLVFRSFYFIMKGLSRPVIMPTQDMVSIAGVLDYFRAFRGRWGLSLMAVLLEGAETGLR